MSRVETHDGKEYVRIAGNAIDFERQSTPVTLVQGGEEVGAKLPAVRLDFPFVIAGDKGLDMTMPEGGIVVDTTPKKPGHGLVAYDKVTFYETYGQPNRGKNFAQSDEHLIRSGRSPISEAKFSDAPLQSGQRIKDVVKEAIEDVLRANGGQSPAG